MIKIQERERNGFGLDLSNGSEESVTHFEADERERIWLAQLQINEKL